MSIRTGSREMIERSDMSGALTYLESERFSEVDCFLEGIRGRFPDIGIELCPGPILALWNRDDEGHEIEAPCVIIEEMQ